MGVFVVRARVWPKPARYLPLAASLLLPVDILLIVAGTGEWTQIVVRSVYLAASYGVLGLAVMRQVAAAEGTAGVESGVGQAAATG